jgi:hypothetical protein
MEISYIEMIDLYDRLLNKAKSIVQNPPYSIYPQEIEFLKIRLEGDNIVLSWPEAQSGYYNSCDIREQKAMFPFKLLLMSDEELSEWQTEETDKQKKKEQARQRNQKKLQKQRELAELRRLKAKYESK